MRKKDVYLSKMCLIFGLLMLCFALACLLMGIPWVAAALLVLIGGGLILAWVNQWVIMVDEQTFISSTMFGIKRTVRFCDIVKYKISTGRSPDGWLTTRFCRVFIESNAYISKRFAQAVNASLPAVGTDRLMANEKK